LADATWLVPELPDRTQIKHRYNEPAVPAHVVIGDGGAVRVELELPESGVAPGQACVLYDGSRLLGGGWIARTLPAGRLDSAGAAA
jgi:tRNA-uridine 2-sulfurtransferase